MFNKFLSKFFGNSNKFEKDAESSKISYKDNNTFLLAGSPIKSDVIECFNRILISKISNNQGLIYFDRSCQANTPTYLNNYLKVNNIDKEIIELNDEVFNIEEAVNSKNIYYITTSDSFLHSEEFKQLFLELSDFLLNKKQYHPTTIFTNGHERYYDDFWIHIQSRIRSTGPQNQIFHLCFRPEVVNDVFFANTHIALYFKPDNLKEVAKKLIDIRGLDGIELFNQLTSPDKCISFINGGMNAETSSTLIPLKSAI